MRYWFQIIKFKQYTSKHDVDKVRYHAPSGNHSAVSFWNLSNRGNLHTCSQTKARPGSISQKTLHSPLRSRRW